MQDSILAVFRNRRVLSCILVFCACLTLLHLRGLPNFGSLSQSAVGDSAASSLACGNWAGAKDTLLILRTGATEIAARLPVHTTRSLRCFPNHIIFSDYEENYLGERVFDALESVDPSIVAHNDDFELYRRLKRDGRTGLAPGELYGVPDGQILNPTGHSEIPGWKLDKWKFVPMVNRTLYEYPDMKWYVFIEADTSILWSTMQAYLARSDPTVAQYQGFDTFIGGECVFAHGGSGFIVSQPALRAVVDFYSEHKAEIEAFTDTTWAGDYVLGKAFLDSGVSFTGIWPLTQGESTGHTNFAKLGSPSVPREEMQVWCYPAGTYHHMVPDAIESLWEFEQQWLRDRVSVSHIALEARCDLLLTSLGHGSASPQRHLQTLCNAADVGSAYGLGQ